MTTTETLPIRINVMKVVTYDVEGLVNEIRIEKNDENYNPDLGEVLEHIEGLAKDDFSCGWGHEADLGELIFQDENGLEL